MMKTLKRSSNLARRPAQPSTQTPANLARLMRSMDQHVAVPIRPRGAASSSTDCNVSTTGTTIDTTGLNRIRSIDTYNHTVTAECGVRIGALVAALAEKGLELPGNFEQTERTLGGAIASPCMGPGIGGQASMLSNHVMSLKAVTATGKVMNVSVTQQHLLSAFRLSYGLLGTIYEVTLKVRPITTFTARHRKMDIETFAEISGKLAKPDMGIRFALMPYLNQVFLDLRHYDADAGSTWNAPWKIKDWGESTVLPHVFKSLGKVVPIPSVRYQLVDKISSATHDMMSSRYVSSGNNAASCGRHGRRKGSPVLQSTWCFPASDFSVVVMAYAKFCRETFARTGYRCDMPAIGYRVARDNTALLSPSFDEPMIALQTGSTQQRGWDDFALDLSEFAENWGGTPLFNQSQVIRESYVTQTYAGRLEFFRKIRRQLDPDNRLLNSYFARYFR